MNHPLHQFLIEFREPATTAELWCELSMVRRWAEAKDLPATFDELARELRKLAVAGDVAFEDEKWRPVVKASKPERMLFA